MLLFYLLLELLFLVTNVLSECSDVSFSATEATIGSLKRIQRISISGHISAYIVEISISDNEFDTVYQNNGNPMVVYSTLSHVPAWSHVDLLASQLRIKNAYGLEEADVRNPLLMLTVCEAGSLSPSHITAGRALDDGKWHELRWLHQFDSVQLAIDGIVLNQTTPTGLYRKLDFHNHMPKPPSLTLHENSRAFTPFSFLPFSFEFRILPVHSVLLDMVDADNKTLLQTTVEDGKTLHLVSNVTRFKQIAHPPNLPRSCEEWWSSRNNRTRLPGAGKNVTIDLDGGGPMKPMTVICKMMKDDMGVDVYMRFSCRGGARLMTQGDERSPSSWYATRSEKHGLQWGDAPPYSRMCSCATNGTCIHNRMCNCDSGEDATDEGVNPYAQLLPVTGLFLGGTTKTSSIEVEIGPLICNRRVSTKTPPQKVWRTLYTTRRISQKKNAAVRYIDKYYVEQEFEYCMVTTRRI
ncbi:hypothetical protein RB195_001570 [Necator americanus]|uniref:Laminin G domain protein n=1 Tax=Necator americanus TaxID=51031 RepID=A0ABR1DG40_NECAM